MNPLRGSFAIGLVLILLASAAAGLLAWRNADTLANKFEPQAISLQRWAHRFIYSWGFDLPGTPDLDHLDQRLSAGGFTRGSPVFIRIFKRDFQLELWMLRGAKFERFASYPICRWSGLLGPKLHTGDRQAPEGFYTVDATQLNPQSRWHRSFNLGFPNAYDRAKGRTGSFLMVHGGCGSVGCYAMTNAVIDEIWALVETALKRGQKRFQVQVLPFRLTDEALKKHENYPSSEFWRELKPGFDLFEKEGLPPRVRVCQGRYAFQSGIGQPEGSAPIDATCK